MISESQYHEAIRIVNEYTEQIRINTARALKKTGITKTPREIGTGWDDWIVYFPNISVRLINVLKFHFSDRRICDISKKEFLSVRNAGLGSWTELCYLTGQY